MATHIITHITSTPRANALTKAWQRVCVPNSKTKTTDKPTEEKKHRSDNSGFAKVAVQCFYDSEVVNQNLVLRLKFCGDNRHLRKAANRYGQV